MPQWIGAQTLTLNTGTYRWIILALIFFCLAVSFTVWYSFTVFLVALTEEFGWSRSTISLAFSIFLLVGGPVSLGTGYALKRVGVRPVMLAGGIIMAVGLALTSLTSEPWMLYLSFGVLTSVGAGMAGWVACVTAASEWFKTNLGTALGVSSTGIAAAMMVLVPLTQYLVLTYGWRATYLILAAMSIVVVVPSALMFRPAPPPEQSPSEPSASGGITRGPEETWHGDDAHRVEQGYVILDGNWTSTEWSLHNAVRTRQFWAILSAVVLLSVATQMVLAHQLAALTQYGMDKILAAGAVAVVGLASGIGKVSWGVISDRLGREITYSIGIAFGVAGIVAILAVGTLHLFWLAYVYAAFFGLGYAANAPLQPTLTSDLFRGRGFPTIFGTISAAGCLGGAIGALLAGVVFDLTGTYFLAFLAAMSAEAIAMALVWVGGPRAIRRPASTLRPRKASRS